MGLASIPLKRPNRFEGKRLAGKAGPNASRRWIDALDSF
jgi:hypothetical protein